MVWLLVWNRVGAALFGARPEEMAVELRHDHVTKLVVPIAFFLRFHIAEIGKLASNELEIAEFSAVMVVARSPRAP